MDLSVTSPVLLSMIGMIETYFLSSYQSDLAFFLVVILKVIHVLATQCRKERHLPNDRRSLWMGGGSKDGLPAGAYITSSG